MKNMQSLRRRRRHRHLPSSISYAPSCLFVSFFFFFFFVFFFTFFPRHSSRCNIAGSWRPALVLYLPSILSLSLSIFLPFGCCVFCITKCKLILLLQARGRGRYVAFLLVARMKFNGFHFVVVCNDPRATPRQHAMPVWGGAEQTARWGKTRGGYAKHFVLFCHVNYASAAFLLVVIVVAVAVSRNDTEIIIFCLI